jgi:hypothetical protein
MLSATLRRVIVADSIWQRNSTMVSAVVAVLILIIGLLITWIWRRRDKATKTLDYRVVSDIPIVTRHDRPERLKIVYGTLEVIDPFITEIRFRNTGKQVIEATDFLEPLVISRPAAKLFDFNVVDQSEDNLVEKIEHVPPTQDRPGKVNVIPKTLNPGDWFTVQLLYDGDPSSPSTITGRIKGQTRRPRVYLTRQQRSAGIGLGAPTSALLMGLFATLAPLIALSFLVPQQDSHRSPTPLRVAAISVGVLIIIAWVVVGVIKRRLLEAKLNAGQQIPDPD